jgi:polysaccharide pyruvyl transferase WcaK-like protein
MNKSASQPLKFFILGYFGWNNMGDDAIGLAILKELSSRYNNSDFTITANEDYFLLKNNLQNIKQIKFDILSILWSIFKSDIFIIAGGTHFQDQDEYFFRRLKLNLFFYSISFFARIFKKSPILFEHGVGHLKSKSSLIFIKQILKNSRGIVLRDSKSFDFIQSLNTGIKCFKGFDVTASLMKYIDYDNNSSNRVLGVSVLPMYNIYSKTPEKDALIVKGFSISIDRILKEHKDIKIKLFEFRSSEIDSDGPILTEISNNIY